VHNAAGFLDGPTAIANFPMVINFNQVKSKDVSWRVSFNGSMAGSCVLAHEHKLNLESGLVEGLT